MIDTAIILAGGLGTRLRAVVPDLPKPMAPVNGRPFLSHLMDYWLEQGICRFILSIGYKSHAVRDHYGERYRHADIDYAIEETPLGTGGGLLLAMRELQGSGHFLVLNGDTFFAVDLTSCWQDHARANADMTMALLDVADNDRYGGVAMDADGRVISLSESRSGSENRRVNGGVYLMRTGLFDGLASAGQAYSLEDELFPSLLQSDRKVIGHLSSGMFIDIGVPEDYRRASTLLAEVSA